MKGTGPVVLLLGTRKGAFIYRSDPSRRTWRVDGPHMLGSIVHHLVLDPRDRRTLLMAAKTGHLGPTVFRSRDWGKTWTEAKAPPAFPKAPEGETGRAVDHTFWLSPGHARQPGVWYAGTSPLGLFRSDDGGATWSGVIGFNENSLMMKLAKDADGTPDGAKLHSILVDPRDPRHLYLSMSSGGTFESRDEAATWRPLNKGVAADFLPDKYPSTGRTRTACSSIPSCPIASTSRTTVASTGSTGLETPGLQAH